MKLDLSSFRQNFVKDTLEDLAEISAKRQVSRLPEGTHEVVVHSIHEKDDVKYKITDKLGGSVGFSLIVKDSQHREQMVYMTIPLAASLKQACLEGDRKLSFPYINTVKYLNCMGVDPILFRESILASDCESIETLVGVQFILINSWDSKKLHLEYDSTVKANYFVTSSGERFSSGEIAAPIQLDNSKRDDTRFNEAIAIAHAHGYQLATRMDTQIVSHPAASNQSVNEALKKFIKPKKEAQPIINKTIPAFPVKKITVPLTLEPDIEF